MVISIYDIQRAVADKATVPIYCESRISKLSLSAAELPKLDAEFEEITEGEELTKKEKLKTKWAALEALVGDPKRIALDAADLVAHFEKRLVAMDGKAMIVCMSRRIAVDLYNALIALRPDWASAKDDDAEAEKGKPCVAKVVMTGSADHGPEWQPHIPAGQEHILEQDDGKKCLVAGEGGLGSSQRFVQDCSSRGEEALIPLRFEPRYLGCYGVLESPRQDSAGSRGKQKTEIRGTLPEPRPCDS